MRNSGSPKPTASPSRARTSSTTQSAGAGISLIIFMASMRHRVSPFFTCLPGAAKASSPGAGAA